MGFYLAQFLTGLASASSLFLVASGLSIIFGVTRIVNFAHGSFFMLGAYLAYTFVQILPQGIFGFWGAILVASLAVGLIGVLIEMTLFRRIYRAPELFQLVATFGVVLVIQDLTLWLWGPEDQFGPRAPGLEGAVRIMGEPIPEYDILLIFFGPAVLLGIWLLFNKTRWGTLVRAATQDREMVGALGVNQSWLFTSVFFVGSFLAGLGGAIQLPREAANLLMDLNVIGEAFVVVVIGGMGSVPGAFLASVLIGELNAFGILIFPEITLVLAFLVMAVVLVVRPWGLLGRPDVVLRGSAGPAEGPLQPFTSTARLVLFGGLVLLLAAPLILGDFEIVLLTDVLIFILFAVSLHLIMGPGGMVSFGHAAYFGLGAYGAALAVKYLGVNMLGGMVLAPVAAGLGALVFGWFCVRLSGVYLAMLTLAAAQITWSVAFQWQDVTGGDDGILGVWPAEWVSGKAAYYYVTLTLVGCGLFFIRRLIFSPFGFSLRAGRDSPLRVEAIGINLKTQQWIGFVVAGLFAGLAGGLYVYSKGSVFPDELAISRSVDGLVMVLLGGIQSLIGPIVGAVSFIVLEDLVTRLDYWRIIFGSIILFIVIVAPEGLAGFARRFLPQKLAGRDLMGGGGA
ncbi:ABC transporter permease [Sneathiella chinensis]|uniref:Branched-chain amino acid ABC transporter permease n=1 Tax=Sneathiella chinensis TaxID=349750 RepID=A0ABQ5U062_9PROT|nr:ABC transporter permease [Sneathiella chinensis]GLQ05539.1 branched-chain amino acid ABC transporter permease [Sneathiella chinensis]